MKLPFKSRTDFAPDADHVSFAEEEQATPTGSRKFTGVLALIVRERVALLELIGEDEEFVLEPPRILWRLQLLREWSHEQVEQIFC